MELVWELRRVIKMSSGPLSKAYRLHELLKLTMVFLMFQLVICLGRGYFFVATSPSYSDRLTRARIPKEPRAIKKRPARSYFNLVSLASLT